MNDVIAVMKEYTLRQITRVYGGLSQMKTTLKKEVFTMRRDVNSWIIGAVMADPKDNRKVVNHENHGSWIDEGMTIKWFDGIESNYTNWAKGHPRWFGVSQLYQF